MQDKTIKLTLSTDYKTTGNDSGQQIDTLAMATPRVWTSNEMIDNNACYLCDVEVEAMENYDSFEDDFIATLSARERGYYAGNIEEFEIALKAYIVTTKENYEQGDGSNLDKAVQEAVDWAQDDMKHHWLYGDRSNDGLITLASRYFDVEFSYDEKTDEITATVTGNKIEELREEGRINTATTEEVRDWLHGEIHGSAIAEHSKEVEQAEKRREERQRAQEYAAKRQAEDRKALQEKLKR